MISSTRSRRGWVVVLAAALLVRDAIPQAIKEFEATSTKWGFMSGDSRPNGMPTYVSGTCSPRKLPCSSNNPPLNPGARLYRSSWQAFGSRNATTTTTTTIATLPEVDLFVFGGYGSDKQYLNNDMWRYSDSQWIWLGGAAPSHLNVVSTKTWPGDRLGSAVWQPRSNLGNNSDDLDINVLMFGGWGVTDMTAAEYVPLDDMWLIEIGREAMSKPNATPLVPVTTTGAQPVARLFASTWSVPHGTAADVETHWLFAGWNASGSLFSGNSFSDLWSFTFEPAGSESSSALITWTQHNTPFDDDADGYDDTSNWPSPRHASATWTIALDNGITTCVFIIFCRDAREARCSCLVAQTGRSRRARSR